MSRTTIENFRLRPPSPEALQDLLLQALPVYWYDRTGVPNYLRPNDALDLIHFLDRYFVLYDDNAFTGARIVLEEISSGRKEDWLPLTAEGLRRVLQLGVVQTLNETEQPLGDEFEGRFRYNILLPFDMNGQPAWLVEVWYRHLNGRDSLLLRQTTVGVYERVPSELVYVGSWYVTPQVIDEYDLTGDSNPELMLSYNSDPDTIERIDVYQWDEETLRVRS